MIWEAALAVLVTNIIVGVSAWRMGFMAGQLNSDGEDDE